MTTDTVTEAPVDPEFFDRAPDLKSPSPLYGYARMWNLLRMGGKTLAARPQAVLVRHKDHKGIEYLETDGFAWGWHRDGRWEQEHDQEADNETFGHMLAELVSAGARPVSPEIHLHA